MTLVLVSPVALAAPRQPAAGEILLRLKKMQVVGSVLYIAAHPDDENTTMLAWLANDRLVRAGYLSITRGDGGQNLIGAEQGNRLGVIRTQELLAARRIDDAEQWFTRARDFGYSKTPDETTRIWGEDEILKDVVWAIRRFRPDVIVSRFSTDHGDGNHGHHTASARLALAAFGKAADPKYAPEQMEHVAPWQARRLYWNRSSWSIKPEDDLSGFLKLDIGAWSPLLGRSFGEVSAESRSMHKSQGFGAAANRGPIVEYLKSIAGDGGKARGMLDGIDVSWARFPGTQKLADLLARAEHEFKPQAPESVIPILVEADAALDAVQDPGWKTHKRRELHDAIAACAGLWLDVAAEDWSGVPGGAAKLKATALNRSGAKVTLREVRFPDGNAAGKPLARGEPLVIERSVAIPATTVLTTPYWLAENGPEGRHQISDQRLIGMPEGGPALEARFEVEVGGRRLSFARPVVYRWTDPVAGERERPFEILPPVSVTPESRLLVSADGKPRALNVLVKAYAGKQSGKLWASVPYGWAIEPEAAAYDLAAKGDEVSLTFRVRPSGKPRNAAAVIFTVDSGGQKRPAQWVEHVEHAHIPIQAMVGAAGCSLVGVSLERGGVSRLGYVPGAGDEVPAALRGAGYDVTLLDDAALGEATARDLGRFDAIVVGVRAYNTNERLRFVQPKLLDYVKLGGTLVVQYSTQSRFAKLATSSIGPLPFEITRDRVTDETAKVTFALPKHAALTSPNPIGPDDFAGWVQERGLYFAGKWDAGYQAPIEIADPAEKPSRGSLIVARHGRGRFVYTGLAFFRQLPAGVPGAYRLFANLLALGHGQARHGAR